MVTESGKTNNVLVVFDFDGTLVFDDGSHEDFDVVRELLKLGVETAIASRNDKYHVQRQLTVLGISELFRYVMADFRPKSYQMKHILWLFSRRNVEFSRVYFVDDYTPNIDRMKSDLREVINLQYGKDIELLWNLIPIVTAK